MSPFRSKAQQRYLESHPDKIGGKAKLKEWESATDFSSLPEKKDDPPMKKPLSHIANEIEKKGTKGVFKAAAERAGKSTREYAEENKHASGKLGKRARLALTFMSAHKG